MYTLFIEQNTNKVLYGFKAPPTVILVVTRINV